MNIKLVIKDIEYRDALIKAISMSDKGLYVEVSDDLSADTETMFVTDNRRLLELEGGVASGYTLVYLSEHHKEKRLDPPGPFILFKYDDMNVMIQELVLCNFLVNGTEISSLCKGKMIGICDSGGAIDSSKFASEFSRKLAELTDRRVLLLSLKYLNQYGSSSGDAFSVHKLFFYYRKNNDVPIDLFFGSDNYNVFYMNADDG